MDTAVRILNNLKSRYSTARSTSEGRLPNQGSNSDAYLVADKAPSRENGLLNHAQPPIIALQGLRKDNHFPETMELRCYVKEPRPFLAGFRSFVMDSFVAEGLMPVPRTGTFREVTQKIMKTDFLRSNVLNEKITLRGKGFYLTPKFDVSDLLPKYEDFPWTNNFPLEKLCITEMGLQDLYRKGKLVGETYRDIACIPLPGVSASEVTAGHPEDQYTKAARSRRKNFPVTPLLIPSMPPA